MPTVILKGYWMVPQILQSSQKYVLLENAPEISEYMFACSACIFFQLVVFFQSSWLSLPFLNACACKEKRCACVLAKTIQYPYQKVIMLFISKVFIILSASIYLEFIFICLKTKKTVRSFTSNISSRGTKGNSRQVGACSTYFLFPIL